MENINVIIAGSNEYKKIHYEVGRDHGKPSFCEHCKSTDKLKYQWAHKHASSWSTDRNNWIRLCVKCHDKYDGHPTNGFSGKNHSEVSKIKTSQSVKKHVESLSEEERKKYGNQAWIGRSHSEEAKRKISESKIGKSSPKKGIPLSEEAKANMRKPKRRIECEICGLSVVQITRHMKNYHE